MLICLRHKEYCVKIRKYFILFTRNSYVVPVCRLKMDYQIGRHAFVLQDFVLAHLQHQHHVLQIALDLLVSTINADRMLQTDRFKEKWFPTRSNLHFSHSNEALNSFALHFRELQVFILIFSPKLQLSWNWNVIDLLSHFSNGTFASIYFWFYWNCAQAVPHSFLNNTTLASDSDLYKWPIFIR